MEEEIDKGEGEVKEREKRGKGECKEMGGGKKEGERVK